MRETLSHSKRFIITQMTDAEETRKEMSLLQKLGVTEEHCRIPPASDSPGEAKQGGAGAASVIVKPLSASKSPADEEEVQFSSVQTELLSSFLSGCAWFVCRKSLPVCPRSNIRPMFD